jgi:hypothetical protein
VLTAQVLNSFPVYVRCLILKVEQQPQLKARIRDCDLDSVIARQLPGLLHIRVFVNVKYAPDTVESEILIPAPLSFTLGLFLHLDSLFDHAFGHAARNDFQMYDPALYLTNIVKVRTFSHRTLTNDQKAGARRTKTSSAA